VVLESGSWRGGTLDELYIALDILYVILDQLYVTLNNHYIRKAFIGEWVENRVTMEEKKHCNMVWLSQPRLGRYRTPLVPGDIRVVRAIIVIEKKLVCLLSVCFSMLARFPSLFITPRLAGPKHDSAVYFIARNYLPLGLLGFCLQAYFDLPEPEYAAPKHTKRPQPDPPLLPCAISPGHN